MSLGECALLNGAGVLELVDDDPGRAPLCTGILSVSKLPAPVVEHGDELLDRRAGDVIIILKQLVDETVDFAHQALV